MKRDFILPEQDVDFLNSAGFPWETLLEGGIRWLIIHDFPIPNGYNNSKARIALMIDPGYPVSQIDMVYFYPAVLRLDNKPIGAITGQAIQGLQFQRWSRHRTGENPWRPGLDDLSTHISMVENWLTKELQK